MDDATTVEMCTTLEGQGYTFDQFAINDEGIEVTYPNGETRRYSQGISISPHLLTSINRDFSGSNLLMNGEMERLNELATNFCQDYRHIATSLNYPHSIEQVLMWDYVNGVRGIFVFGEMCEVTDTYGWSTGSYASSYELLPDATCPSGKVQF